MSRIDHWLDHRLASVGAALGLLALSPTVLRAQSRDSISASTRVRIDFPTRERPRFRREHVQSVVGALDGVHADTLLVVVRPGAAPLRIPRAAVGTLYVSRGRPPRWRSALDWAVVPALITAALSAAGASVRRKEGDPSPRQMGASSAAWVGATGALLGAWSPKERWRAVPRPDSIASVASSTRAQ
ncbi:MAG TPA: hypothetical protein VM076_09440 [Gemmatimonadaceae bacterium]|nr:hypothetical protein [Gemmatimonadaceae bacterium]